ncbi:MAG: tetratricopeptide repeat protein [Methanoregula sp.]|jgi:tetratricopeptide (TPR) repeat protein
MNKDELNILGITCQSVNNFDAAQYCFDQAINLAPNDVPTLRNLGLLYLARKNFANALAYFQRVLILNPNDQMTRFDVARTFIEQQNFPMAIIKMREALELPVQNNRIFFLNELGKIYNLTGQYPDAVICLKEAIVFEPDNLYTNYLLALSYYGQTVHDDYFLQTSSKSNLDHARDQFLNINNKLRQNLPEVLCMISKVYRDYGLFKESLKFIERAIEISPTIERYREIFRDIKIRKRLYDGVYLSFFSIILICSIIIYFINNGNLVLLSGIPISAIILGLLRHYFIFGNKSFNYLYNYHVNKMKVKNPNYLDNLNKFEINPFFGLNNC